MPATFLVVKVFFIIKRSKKNFRSVKTLSNLNKHFPHVEKAQFFYHPDYTVGLGISPNQPTKRLADFNCRWRISLRPKEFSYVIFVIILYNY